MRVGMGVTVWAKGAVSNRLDGIGHYTQELFRCFRATHDDMQIAPVVFGAESCPVLDGNSITRWPHYSMSALWAVGSGRSFPGTGSLRDEFDLFHATDHLTPKLTGVPVVATLMDAIPLSHPQWVNQRARGLKNWLWKASGHWADHVITISDFSKSEIVRWFGISEQKISVTPLGVDARYFERFDNARAVYFAKLMNLPERYFLFVGTFQPRKNIDRIIDAHEKMPPSLRKEVPLLIVGQSGWGADSLVARLKASASEGEVRWLQHVDDLAKRALMQRATALVFPSLLEGFGLPVLEGFASQTPVITSNTSSLLEVAGDAAWTVDPYDVAAITEAMVTLARDEAAGRKLVTKGLERARKFTWNACARQTEAAYARVMGGG